MRIAVLDTNIDTSSFAARYPTDGEKVVRCFAQERPDWRYDQYRTPFGQFPSSLAGVDALVITGSPACVNDDVLWIKHAALAVQEAYAKDIPTVGICFGHQLIAHALGGKVTRSNSWGLGVRHADVTTQKSWMQPWTNRLTLSSAHEDQVTTLPKHATNLGGSEQCPIGLYSVTSAAGIELMLGVQNHPELSRIFMQDFVADLQSAEHSKIPPQVLAQAAAQVADGGEHEQLVNAPVFFKWAVNFIEAAWTSQRNKP